ncbi:hypothetical protein ACFY94_00165 [Streptomyces griseorubiginosus]|uniref:hypothetical protein n=1 Tax=Streptomyces griseorubiginosus TaxID=67304 RepID=UPI0036EF00A4
MTDDVLFLSGEQVARLLDVEAAIASQPAAFTALGSGAAGPPARIMHPSRFDDSVVLAHVSRLSADSGAAARFGSVDPGNAASGPPTVHAGVTVPAPETGRPVAVLDGIAVTTLRTAATSAAAVEAQPPHLVALGIQEMAAARAVVRAAQGESA